MALLLSSEVL